MVSGIEDPEIARVIGNSFDSLPPEKVAGISHAIGEMAESKRLDAIWAHYYTTFALQQTCQSPMELLLGAHLMLIGDGYSGVVLYSDNLSFSPQLSYPATIWCTQIQIDRYRADFVFAQRAAAADVPRLLVVEVDGHEFHERTKAQAAHDLSRDRFMHLRRISVMRFTGSEIFADPQGCAQQVQIALENTMSDLVEGRR